MKKRQGDIFLADKNKSVQNEFNEDGALIALTDENGKEVVFLKFSALLIMTMMNLLF